MTFLGETLLGNRWVAWGTRGSPEEHVGRLGTCRAQRIDSFVLSMATQCVMIGAAQPREGRH